MVDEVVYHNGTLHNGGFSSECLTCVNLQVGELQKKLGQWHRIVAAALAWEAYNRQDRFLEQLADAISGYRKDAVVPTLEQQLQESNRLNGEMKRRCVQVVAAKLHEISAGLEGATPGIDSPSILSQLTESIMAMDFVEKRKCDKPVNSFGLAHLCGNDLPCEEHK